VIYYGEGHFHITVNQSQCFRWEPEGLDNDGLGIATERGDVIGAWACFHIHDIFVEVDWMEGHEMSNEAVAKVAWAFARHGIALHIDRGEMGGGTMIPHENNFRSNWSYYYDNYFSSLRREIFHYLVIAHRDTDGSGTTLGRGFAPGKMFVLFDDLLGGDWWPGGYSRDTKQAKVFQQELGHNIIGTPTWDGALVDSQHYDANGHSVDSSSLMWPTMDFGHDFTSYDWSVVNPALSFSPGGPP